MIFQPLETMTSNANDVKKYFARWLQMANVIAKLRLSGNGSTPTTRLDFPAPNLEALAQQISQGVPKKKRASGHWKSRRDDDARRLRRSL